MLSNLKSLVKREYAARAGPVPSLSNDKYKKDVSIASAKIAELEEVAKRSLPDVLITHLIEWNKSLENSKKEDCERYLDDRSDSPTNGELLTFKEVFLSSQCLEHLVVHLVASKDSTSDLFTSQAFTSAVFPQLLGHCCIGGSSIHFSFAQTIKDVAPRVVGRQLQHVLKIAVVDIVKSLKIHPDCVRVEIQIDEVMKKLNALRTQVGIPVFRSLNTSNDSNEDGDYADTSTDDVESAVATGPKVLSLLHLCEQRRNLEHQYNTLRTPNMNQVKDTYDSTARDMDTLSFCLTENRRAANTKMEMIHRLRECSIRDRDESLSELERLEQLVMKEEHRLVDHAQDLRTQMRLTKHAILELEKQRRQLEEDRMITARKYEMQLRKLNNMEYNMNLYVKHKQTDQEAVKSVTSLAEWCRPILYEEYESQSKSQTSNSEERLEEHLSIGEWYLEKLHKIVQEQDQKPKSRLEELESVSQQLIGELDAYIQRYASSSSSSSSSSDIHATRVAAAAQSLSQLFSQLKTESKDSVDSSVPLSPPPMSILSTQTQPHSSTDT